MPFPHLCDFPEAAAFPVTDISHGIAETEGYGVPWRQKAVMPKRDD
jgi:hypothetical protein